MFLQAGFNGRNYRTGIVGWTRHVRDEKRRFRPAQLRGFESGDLFWHGNHPDGGGFMAWGDQVVLGTWHGFELAWEYQNYLPQCDLVTREELVPWPWVEERRRKMEAGEPVE